MNEALKELFNALLRGEPKALARCISLVENSSEGYQDLLESLQFNKPCRLLGITGPPGAGKSTLINALLSKLSEQGKKTAILAVDPSSPFNYGALLGDRIRMAEHFNNKNVFIRSMASRGSLGGLAPRIYEVCDVLKAAGFDYVIVETIGVGQTEVEIAGLADTTALVLVPEAGDEIQSIKAGIMEIADIFVLNKADREGADTFYKNLLALAHGNNIPVLKTVAAESKGLDELLNAIEQHQASAQFLRKKQYLLAAKALNMIREERSRDVNRQTLQEEIGHEMNNTGFNLYKYVRKWYKA